MNYLSVENIAKNYGERVLFENLSFGLSKGDKVALVANNGAGKSSMLKILVGKDTPDEGEVTYRDGIKTGFLAQDPVFDENLLVSELIYSANSEVLQVIRDYEKSVEEQSENYNDATQKAFESAIAKMDRYQAWDYERRLEQLLSMFRITDQQQRIGVLSGGQKKRLALALVLLDNPDLLILDEPTNHLDIDMIEWLENYLGQSNITLLMVTHDRYFLDPVCNHIFELTDGKLYQHKGNYSFFLEKMAERESAFQTEVEKAGKLMKQELQWMRRMPKARTTKSKSRISAFHETKEKAGSGKKKQELKLEVKMSRIGGKVLEMKKVYKSYGDIKILSGFDYSFKKGERIGILGKNGVGKSTFLNIITGREEADSGKINTGETIVYGYYSQMGMKLKEDKRVIEVLKDIAEVITLANGSKITASQFLEHFMFPPKMQYTQVSKLSGGEQRRLYLLTVLMKNPNFLILDEPTNNLDLLTLYKLEEFIVNFGGCLIVVSHDRYFMDKLIDHLFVFEGDGVIRDFTGNYSDFQAAESEKTASGKKEQVKIKQEIKKKAADLRESQKLSYKEKLEYEGLEKEIGEMEQEKALLEKSLMEAPDDYETIEKASGRIGELTRSIESKTPRWMELAERG